MELIRRFHPSELQWPARARAAGLHFAISMVVALAVGLAVFAFWYPYPYREISGGRELFAIVVMVDVVLGPLITLAIFDARKSRRELFADVSLVALIQMLALGYGLWTVAMARPVHLVFEVDRLRVVHRIEVADELLARAPKDVSPLPLSGPSLLAVRPYKDAKERMDATLAELNGLRLAFRPDFWENYAQSKPRVLQAARPVSGLKARLPARAGEIDSALAGTGLPADQALYLPMVGRNFYWTAFLNPVTAEVVAFLPLDPF